MASGVFGPDHDDQGIVHVIGPELGLVHPGMTVICADSHTTTLGALGALAFAVGTTQVLHALATQCVLQQRARTMRIAIDGALRPGVTAKDLILALLARPASTPRPDAPSSSRAAPCARCRSTSA